MLATGEKGVGKVAVKYQGNSNVNLFSKIFCKQVHFLRNLSNKEMLRRRHDGRRA